MDRLEIVQISHIPFRFFIAPIFLYSLLVGTTCSSANDPVVVTDVSGRKVAGKLESWTADKLLIDAAGNQQLSLKDVRTMSFDRPVQKARGVNSMVWLSNGDRIAARPVSIADDQLTVSWPVLGSADHLKIPLEKVSAVIFEMPATSSERMRLFADLETIAPTSDLVLSTNGDHTLGEFERLDRDFVELKVAKRPLKLDRSRVRAIRFNPQLTNSARASGYRSLLSLADGSRITTTSLELKGETLSLKSQWLRTAAIPLSVVVTGQVLGGRVIPISDCTPAEVVFTPYLSSKWSPVRDRNVLHGPLMVRGAEYSTGLGTHSYMAVTYSLAGDERAFQSVIGIDDAAQGKGSAVFAVELDGRRVWTSPQITGTTPATIVPEINVQGSRKLSLIVEFGQFADVSDYADWCDAVLILDEPR